MISNFYSNFLQKTSFIGVFLLLGFGLPSSQFALAYNLNIESWTTEKSSEKVTIQLFSPTSTSLMSPYAGRLQRMTKDEAAFDLEKGILPVKERYLNTIRYTNDLVGVGTAQPDLLDMISHKVEDEALQNQGIKELIAVGVSDYWGSSEARVHNLRLALWKYDNLIVPQGHTFSFNHHLGPVTSQNGFVQSPIIVEGVSRDGLGGGVCQISTTIFRAGLFAGLEITERWNHSYALAQYHPHGLDSTIYPGQKDLLLKNNTPGDILFRVFDRDQRVFVFVYGTKDRDVRVNLAESEGSVQDGLRTKWNRSISYLAEDSMLHNDDIRSWYKPLYLIDR